MLIQKKSVIMKDHTQILRMRTEDEKLIVTHAQDVGSVMKLAGEKRQKFDKSFKLDRMAWPIAEVPLFIFKRFQNPVTNEVDWKRFDHWLENEGSCFKTS